MLINELLALSVTKAEPVSIEEEYDDSAAFDADMNKVIGHLKDALKIMDSANWEKHLSDTEQNFDVKGLRDAHDKLYNAVDEAINDANDFYDTMGEAT